MSELRSQSPGLGPFSFQRQPTGAAAIVIQRLLDAGFEIVPADRGSTARGNAPVSRARRNSTVSANAITETIARSEFRPRNRTARRQCWATCSCFVADPLLWKSVEMWISGAKTAPREQGPLRLLKCCSPSFDRRTGKGIEAYGLGPFFCTPRRPPVRRDRADARRRRPESDILTVLARREQR